MDTEPREGGDTLGRREGSLGRRQVGRQGMQLGAIVVAIVVDNCGCNGCSCTHGKTLYCALRGAGATGARLLAGIGGYVNWVGVPTVGCL